jgi:sugar/nucleoside kinase (ribokinase family)
MHTYLGITTELSAEQVDFEPLKTAKWLYIEGYLSTSPSARLAVKQAREIAKNMELKLLYRFRILRWFNMPAKVSMN